MPPAIRPLVLKEDVGFIARKAGATPDIPHSDKSHGRGAMKSTQPAAEYGADS